MTKTKWPILNKFFASTFTEKVRRSSFHPFKTRRTENFLNDILIVENDVLQKIYKMKTNKTPRPDKTSPRIEKEVKHWISKPLVILFNKSLRNGKVPSVWKRANATPIFKKWDKSQPGNYRPIRHTSVVCKLMETIIRDNVVKFLEDNYVIKSSQHGFRNKRSCLTNLLDFFHNVYESRAVIVIYLDFQKAFDEVPHQRLLNKLMTHGISGSFYNWLQDWLSERKQRVVLNDVSSQWLNVKIGVPQGSVFDPVLFLIYVNDIDDGITCKILKFADDTKIASKVITTIDREVLQSDLDRLTSWANKWKMKFNVDKCKVLHIERNNDHVQYSMNGKLRSAVTKEEDLGITISNDLKLSKHCSEIVKTANRLVGFTGRTFEYKSKSY